jgi:hypothetical protein
MRHRAACLSVFLLFHVGGLANAASDEEFLFRDGDTVVMIGDSINEQHLYSN